MSDRVVIVGAGLAGHRAAAALVRFGFGGRITIVGDESRACYDRPPLSKKFLAGEMSEEALEFPRQGLEAVEWVTQNGAVGLDPDACRVDLASGEGLPYDRLIIATGRGSRQWPDELGLEGTHTLRTMADSQRLRAGVASAERVAIVGAGFIGCEVAATLTRLGIGEVHLIEMAPQPMPVIGPQAGARAIRLHEGHGVRFHLGTGVKSFLGDVQVRGVELTDGTVLDVDLVLLALGSAPSTSWLAGSGLTLVNGNVLCDEHLMAVGTENIAAAGDVASWPYPGMDEPVSIEHWTTARDMAAIAAANVISEPGQRRPFAAVPSFWSDQYDVKIKSVGLLANADSFTVVEDDADDDGLVIETHRGPELIGALAFNRNRTILGYQRDLAGSLGDRAGVA